MYPHIQNQLHDSSASASCIHGFGIRIVRVGGSTRACDLRAGCQHREQRCNQMLDHNVRSLLFALCFLQTKCPPPEESHTSPRPHDNDLVLVGSRKDTQNPRRINISTPSVADVNSNNRNYIESSTDTPPAHIAVCAPIRLLSSSGQCASAAPHGNLKPSHTPRGIGARADPDVPHTTMERRASCSVRQRRHESQTTSIALRPHQDPAVAARARAMPNTHIANSNPQPRCRPHACGDI